MLALSLLCHLLLSWKALSIVKQCGVSSIHIPHPTSTPRSLPLAVDKAFQLQISESVSNLVLPSGLRSFNHGAFSFSQMSSRTTSSPSPKRSPSSLPCHQSIVPAQIEVRSSFCELYVIYMQLPHLLQYPLSAMEECLYDAIEVSFHCRYREGSWTNVIKADPEVFRHSIQ